ncbi:unnamed protein product [Zymoseptoria tritici ST99CH_3D1]|nr:unnamed protein product [Zymoseptoria tritici ST99CH_3D1]
MLETRQKYWGTGPPAPRSRMENWPTVLFSWWCTSFATVIIITRVLGRKVRNNKFFREDWIMLIALAPLWIRMVFVHFVLTYGTNNVDTVNFSFTEDEIYKRSIGSRMVLASRIFYAMFIWLSKLTVSEFLKRITIRIWRRSYEITLQGIRIFLFLTFGAVVVATLTECNDFEKYWQVVPDPGPQCRKGFAQLITMGTCDIITDIVLIAFPIPVVLRSGQTWQRKLQMVSLFSLSVILIGVTATRMPEVVETGGRQQYRTVWASAEILASAFVANAVTLGSFLRDKGEKKKKYKPYSTTDSMERASARRPTLPTIHQIESDEDLFRSVGYGIPGHLQRKHSITPRPAPQALSAAEQNGGRSQAARNVTSKGEKVERDSDSENSTHEDHYHKKPTLALAQHRTQSVSFSDVGNLLETESPRSKPHSPSIAIDSPGPIIITQDFTISHEPASSSSGSRAFLQDLGGISNNSSSNERQIGRLSPRLHHEAFWHHHNRIRDRSPQPKAPIGVLAPAVERHETSMTLQDAGGLLENSSRRSVATGRDTAVEDIELEDVGSLLSDDTPQDRSAIGLQEMLKRNRQAARTSRSISRQGGGPDDMVLHDPGGLATPQ